MPDEMATSQEYTRGDKFKINQVSSVGFVGIPTSSRPPTVQNSFQETSTESTAYSLRLLVPPYVLRCLLLAQRVFATTFCGRPAILKERFRKTYRLPVLDEKLTTRRTLQVNHLYPAEDTAHLPPVTQDS